MIETKTTATMSLKDARQVIDHLHDSCNVTVTFCADDDLTGRILSRACSLLGLTRNEQLDNEDQVELSTYLKAHPELKTDKQLEHFVKPSFNELINSLPSDDQLDELENPKTAPSITDNLISDEIYDKLDEIELIKYREDHPQIKPEGTFEAPGAEFLFPGKTAGTEVKVVNGKYCVM